MAGSVQLRAEPGVRHRLAALAEKVEERLGLTRSGSREEDILKAAAVLARENNLSAADFLQKLLNLPPEVAHTLAPDSHYHIGLENFGKLLDEASNGRIELEIFHSSQLGSERDAIEGVSMGTLEMTLVSSAPLANFTNGFLVFDLPFIIQDRQKAYEWMDGPEGQKILDSVLSKGMVALGIWENGFRMLTNSKKAVVCGVSDQVDERILQSFQDSFVHLGFSALNLEIHLPAQASGQVSYNFRKSLEKGGEGQHYC
jgi:hypothetical protein